MRASTLRILASCSATCFMVGCGGKGGGYGGYMTPAMAMPTVMFSSPAQATTINFGQTVKLSWASTNASSCSATTSNAMAGAFSGNQPTSGTAAVAPTGPGSATYTVTCMGGGGTASATTAMVTVNPNILSTLSTAKIVTIGPTPDSMEKGGNPYGLVIAPVTAGLITQGDLVVCNFNDGATNTQGLGTTIVGLHPTAGSQPYLIAKDPALQGCSALTMLPDDTISAAAWMSSQNPLVSAAGTVSNPFGAAGDMFAGPWGGAYAAANGQNPAALYVSSFDGSIDRIDLNGDVQSNLTKIATGFCGSGKPGAIYAPAGLTYDPAIDTLYIVDTSSNSVVAFANVSSIGAAGVVVNGQCTSGMPPAPTPTPTPTPTFSGPSMSSARVIAHGGLFNGPISAALLSDGDLIVENDDLAASTGTPNLAFEISPVLPGGFVGQPIQLDATVTLGTTTVIPGALFGIVATVDGQGNQLIYFNNDNINSLMLITK